MKDLIDVAALQRDKGKRRHTDYLAAPGNALAAHYIFECGAKLHAQAATTATAAVLYHKFCRGVDDASAYDCYAVGSACLSLAGKLRDDRLRLRDVLNVSHATLRRAAGPLELNADYWALRGSLAAAELLVLRALAFRPEAPPHHKYLLHYLRSLQEWFAPGEWRAVPLARTAMAFLQDFHHSPAILDYRASHVAVACVCLACNCLGASVPLAGEDDFAWCGVFAKDLTRDKNWEIMEKIMAVYGKDQDAQ